MTEKPEWNIADFAKEVDRRYESRGTADFLRDVIDLLSLFKEVGAAQFVDTFTHVKWLLEHESAATAAEVTLGQYGGMGSFNDLVFCPLNGHLGDAKSLASADKRLCSLRSRLYQHALRIQSSRSER